LLKSTFHRGVELFEKHEFDAARAAFESDLRANPKDAQALYYLGRIAFEQNKVDEAAHFLERATTVAPQFAAAYHWLGRVHGVQARDLGAPRGIGPARRTRKALEKAVQLDPNNLAARVDLATFYREAPGIVGGSTHGAREQLEEINRRDPYLGLLIQGDLAMDQKTFEDAERFYQAAVQRSPKTAEAHFRLGILYQRTRRFDAAFASFERVLQLDPNERAALFQIGKTADQSGQQLSRGEEALKQYLQCKPFFVMPKLAWAHRRLGNIYLKKGLREAARTEYLAAVRMAPDDKEAAAALKQFEAAEGR
jgi:tetratricopeptide (TPR) repeat protein